MALILVVNAGSTSIKYALFAGEERILTVQYDKKGDGCLRTVDNAETHHNSTLFDTTAEDMRTLLPPQPIDALGFRVVHGGPQLQKTSRIDTSVMEAIADAAVLAPLHNYACLALIQAWQNVWPSTPMFAVFDTAFHTTIPAYAATYAIPEVWRQEYSIKRYGFHGISCQSVLRQLSLELGELPKRVIICHLGGGCSVTAVLAGKSVDTSMGFSPMEGLMMATRAGDIDSGVLFFIQDRLREAGMDAAKAAEEAERILMKESGLLAMAETESMKEVLLRCTQGDSKAMLARDMFVYRLQKYIGAYSAILGGVDVVVFTGGIGHNAAAIRQLTAAPFPSAKIHHYPSDEEFEIARQVHNQISVDTGNLSL